MATGIPRAVYSKDVLGIAFVSNAFAFYMNASSETAHERRIPEYMILGRTMAHEVGHLLLGENSHTTRGLMRSLFDLRD